jgi:hypothetical protein
MFPFMSFFTGYKHSITPKEGKKVCLRKVVGREKKDGKKMKSHGNE